jgi:hypothetical protein
MQTAPASDIQPAVALLEKTPVVFETLLRDLPTELLRWKPAPDRWSISEVLAHLADIEEVYAERSRRIMAESSPALQRYDQARAENYSSGTATEHLTRFNTMRRGIVVFLKGLPASAGMRTAVHSELGTITFSQLLHEWAGHTLGHLRQIAELYRAHAFYPHSGPFQRYSNPKP